MSGGDTTVYAHWTVKSYTLTFNANGGSCSESSRKVAYGAAYGTLPTATYSGWVFDGWYTAKSGGTQVTKTTKMGGSNTTVYAHWVSPPPEIIQAKNHTSVTVTLPACSDWKNCQPSITLEVKNSSGSWEFYQSYGLDKNVLSAALVHTFTLDASKEYRVATTGNSTSGWWREADAGAYTRCKQTQCAHVAADDCGITCDWN